MILRLAAFLPLAAPFLFGGYSYYYSDPLTSINPAEWQQVGVVSATASGLTSSNNEGGALISKRPVPDGTSEYEVKARFRLLSSGGIYVLYLRASQDALSSHVPAGTYYAIELQNPVVTATSCWGTLVFYKYVGGVATTLSVMGAPCRDQMEMRVIVRNDLIEARIDNVWQTWVPETAIIAGQPGVGMRQAPAGNAISLVELGPLDRTPPNPVPPQAIAMTAYPNAIEMQWQAPADDPNGTGVVRYDVTRHGLYHRGYRATHFTDESVQPSTSYTFTVYAIDHHFNYSAPTTFTVTTPPVGTVNPRQIGVRNTAAHWGGGGEQINVNSGNLNFTLPLLEAKGRNGQSLALGLSYNSQLWRKDDSGIWKYGRDTGYGFGWKLQAGSLAPYYTDYYALHHYTFTDATGAEYRLDVNNNGIWTSHDALHITYDSRVNGLYFPDGSFWTMGSTSMAMEDDAGTMYPTRIQDSNGSALS